MFNPIVFVHLNDDGSIDSVEASDEGITYFGSAKRKHNGAYPFVLGDCTLLVELTDGLPAVKLVDADDKEFLPTDGSFVNGLTGRYFFSIAVAPSGGDTLAVTVHDNVRMAERLS